eukprot:gene11277-3371_t
MGNTEWNGNRGGERGGYKSQTQQSNKSRKWVADDADEDVLQKSKEQDDRRKARLAEQEKRHTPDESAFQGNSFGNFAYETAGFGRSSGGGRGRGRGQGRGRGRGRAAAPARRTEEDLDAELDAMNQPEDEDHPNQEYMLTEAEAKGSDGDGDGLEVGKFGWRSHPNLRTSSPPPSSSDPSASAPLNLKQRMRILLQHQLVVDHQLTPSQ